MDTAIISGALTSVKIIYDLLKSANDAQLAMKISGELANVQGRLIDAQQQAIAIQDENIRLREEIKILMASLVEHTEGERCPKCGQRTWRLRSSVPDPMFGPVGVSRRYYECSACNFGEAKQVG